MSSEYTESRYTKGALKIFMHSFGDIILIALAGLFLRAVALFPVYAIITKMPVPLLAPKAGTMSVLLWGAVSLLLFIFLVMPSRYFSYEKIRRMAGGHRGGIHKNHYLIYLAMGLRRIGEGLLWGLPFLVLVALWLYAYNGMPFPTFSGLLQGFGSAVGSSRIDTGIIVWLLLIVITGILYAYGWWRRMPADFVNISHLGVNGAFAKAAKIKKNHRKVYWHNMGVNILLTLPSLLLCGVLFILYLKGEISFAGGAFAAAQQMMSMMGSPLPQTVLMELLAVLVIVHLPLCAYRKTRDAVLTQTIVIEERHQEHEAMKENDV